MKNGPPAPHEPVGRLGARVQGIGQGGDTGYPHHGSILVQFSGLFIMIEHCQLLNRIIVKTIVRS